MNTSVNVWTERPDRWNWHPAPGTRRGPLPRIPLWAFDRLAENSSLPLYVIVTGGIAAGKTFVVRNNLTRFKIADIDDYMDSNGFTNYDRDGVEFRMVMDQINVDIQTYKKNKLNMVSMGTGANLDFLKFRLEEAIEHGHHTAILHVVAPVEQALSQNRERGEKGLRRVPDSQIEIIRNTALTSLCNVDIIIEQHRDLLGYLCVYENRRDLIS